MLLSIICCTVMMCYLFQGVTPQNDPCLKGALESLPPQAEWASYTTLDPGLMDSIYLFPFVAFTCNGTLERVTLPFSIRPQDSIFWDNILTAEIAFLRPGMEGYTELTSRLLQRDLSRVLFRFRNGDSPIDGTISLDLSLSIQEGDILGLKLPDSYTAQAPNSVVVEDHIPVLMRRERSSPVLRMDRFPNCLQACTYQVVDFLVPVVSVQFIPMRSVQGTETEDDIEVIPSSSFTTTDQEISSTQSVDVKLTPSGVTPPPTANAAEFSQEENYTAILVLASSTALLLCILLLMVAVVIPCLVVKVRRHPTLHQKASADGSASNDVSAYYENERTISRVKMDTPQERSHPILLHEDVNVHVPHTYEGIVREVSAIYADAAVNEFHDEELYWEPASTPEAIYYQMASKKYLEIPLSSVKKERKLGEGEFGEVFKGEWTTSTSTLTVALKSLKSSASDEERLKLLQEAAIMGQFVHPHIVQLHGVVTLSEQVMVVMDYLSKGDLRSYLLQLREERGTKNREGEALPSQLLRFCQEIADGMQYLSKKGFIHRDLAARNVLLTADTKCKIADFGLTKDLRDHYCYKSCGGRIPVKWTAPEAILYQMSCTKSDVWSYGMVMYEIWSLGHKPFEEWDVQEVVAVIGTGYCQPPPPGCPRGIYAIMVWCWNPDYHFRPTFDHILHDLMTDESFILQMDISEEGSAQCCRLGEPLKCGKEMYTELQNRYNRIVNN